ncbi:MAG: beta-N-acetylhexosaminidase [Clostridiales bacterium]|jgi:hexosaminidase|nr:beta-N-acetylhexosaminidase [Clostridiales bacterium]
MSDPKSKRKVKNKNSSVRSEGARGGFFARIFKKRETPPVYEPPLVPKPYGYQPLEGYFAINKDTLLIADQSRKNYAENFRDMFKRALEHELFIHYNKPGYNNILFEENPSIDPEGYVIECYPDRMKLSAGGAPGFFYAMQSLSQFLRLDTLLSKDVIYCPCMVISDFPKYRYRGFMIDVSRHFFDKTEIKRYIELMSALKFNVFHWHLSDDQGFRFEISNEKYKFINITSSERRGDCVGRPGSQFPYNDKVYKGYYTKDDVKEVVEFAKKRFVTVIPEIDLPGHTQALIAAYPWLGCDESDENGNLKPRPRVGVRVEYGVSEEVLCAGKESTYKFIEDILDEVFEVFDGPYIHIGGDEVLKNHWETCPYCRQKAAEIGGIGLQSYFLNRVAEYCKSNGKRVIGYNDGLNGGADPEIISQFWVEGKEHNESLKSQIRNGGRKFILSSERAFYCDYPYAVTPLKKTYFYKLPADFQSADIKKNMLGIEAPLWTEYVLSRDKADLNLFPRMIAVAEQCWTRQTTDEASIKRKRKRRKYNEARYAGFLNRVKAYEPILDLYRVNYADLKIADPTDKKYLKAERAKWAGSDQYSELKMNKNLAEQRKVIKRNGVLAGKIEENQNREIALDATSYTPIASIKIDLPFDKDMV